MSANRVTTVTVQGVEVAVLEDLEVGILRQNADRDKYRPPNGWYHRALAVRPDSGDLMFVARETGTKRWFLDGNDPNFQDHYQALIKLRAAR